MGAALDGSGGRPAELVGGRAQECVEVVDNGFVLFREWFDARDKAGQELSPLWSFSALEDVAQLGQELGRDATLSNALSSALWECVFVFFNKVHDRLWRPMQVLTTARVPPVYLSYAIQQIIPFIVDQGQKLRRK